MESRPKQENKKRSKVLKRIIIAISALAILTVAALALLLWLSRDYLVWNNSPRPVIAPITVSVMTGYGADALYLVQMAEQVHPIFIMDGYLPNNYEIVRDEFLNAAQNATSRQEFILAAYRYIMTLQDGHISGFNLFGGLGSNGMTSGLIAVDWEVRNEHLWIVDDSTDVEVIAIGGIPTAEVFAVIDAHVFAENEVYRLWNHALYARYGTMIEAAGGEVLGDRIILTLNENGEITTMEAVLEMPEARTEPFSVSAIAATYDFIVRHEMLDDNIFFIDLQIFYLDNSIEETAQYIEQAIENGIRKFIIDLRGNIGGDSRAGSRLLEAMGVSVPTSGVLRRFSPLMMAVAREHDILSPFESAMLSMFSIFADGMIASRSDISTASNPNDVFVTVLTDNNTYSSAMMMAYWVQDGNFGNVIGAPSRNAPSSFGEILPFTLPYSGLEALISATHFSRPDTNANQSIVYPDIKVDPYDALDVALAYLRNHVN